MKFLIHHNDDSIVVSGETTPEIQLKVHDELAKRNWNEDDCWSEKIT